jgi:hypothetical protein
MVMVITLFGVERGGAGWSGVEWGDGGGGGGVWINRTNK